MPSRSVDIVVELALLSVSEPKLIETLVLFVVVGVETDVVSDAIVKLDDVE